LAKGGLVRQTFIESLLKRGIRTEADRIDAHSVANWIIDHLFWTVARHAVTTLEVPLALPQLSDQSPTSHQSIPTSEVEVEGSPRDIQPDAPITQGENAAAIFTHRVPSSERVQTELNRQMESLAPADDNHADRNIHPLSNTVLDVSQLTEGATAPTVLNQLNEMESTRSRFDPRQHTHPVALPTTTFSDQDQLHTAPMRRFDPRQHIHPMAMPTTPFSDQDQLQTEHVDNPLDSQVPFSLRQYAFDPRQYIQPITRNTFDPRQYIQTSALSTPIDQSYEQQAVPTQIPLNPHHHVQPAQTLPQVGQDVVFRQIAVR
jgi:hypothetical protein